MNTDRADYRKYVGKDLERIVEILAHISFGDYSPGIDTSQLADDEFADVYCGLALLMDDLAEARRELDEQNSYNLLRSEIWKSATAHYDTVEAFLNALLTTFASQINVDRASYFEIREGSGEAICIAQWCRAGTTQALGMTLPPKIWHYILGQSSVEVARPTISAEGRDDILGLMKDNTAFAILAATCGNPEAPLGFVIFADSDENRTWSDSERSLIFEVASIVSTKVAQMRAEGALLETNVGLEKQVQKRTAELQEDIEKRKQAEAALRASEERYRGLVEASPDAIILSDAEGTTIMANEAAARVFAMPANKELVGRSWHELISERDRAGAEKVYATLVSRGGVATDECTLVRADGTEFVGESRTVLVGDHRSSSRKYLSVIRDVTEKRRQEEELARANKLESLGTLAGGIAHDFNNILSGVVSNISMAKATLKEGAEAFELLTDAENAALRAGGLTKQLLTFAKGGMPVKERASVREMVEGAARFCLSGSSVKCRLRLPAGLHAVEVDKGQIDQVLNNIFINAVQAMPNGGTIEASASNIQVSSSTKSRPLDEGHYVRIVVKDTGVGISRKDIQSVFDPYFTTKSDGMGLGLAIAHSIVEKHNGLIQCDSRPGKGATFSLYLPSTGKRFEQEARPAATVQAGGRVLIMDDDRSVRTVIGKLLTRAGYETSAFPSGQDAIAAYSDALSGGKRFDAVILDLTIPGEKGGKETVRELLQLDPDARAIVVSGYSNDPVLANYAEHGFCGVLSKPFETHDLLRVVGEAVANGGD